jgi:hypothetical protein
VKAWLEPVVIPTYLPQLPDKNSMFLENRGLPGEQRLRISAAVH